MQCPRCGKELAQQRYESATVDVCRACGVWLDAGELERIIQTHEKAFTTSQIEETLKANAAGLPPGEKTGRAACPKCGACMDTFNYNYSTGIILDSCPYGHGVWLDKGELERVQIHMEHWDREASQKRPDWRKMMDKTSQDLADREARARQARRDMLGPAGRMLESALDALSHIPQQP
ncbi:MAG: zf-TFIIB domain-containing protein [Elusimicrobia bacterium]|nr:zf-TFIIB domain-containing protein [Elusimicrobiota bacterium]